MHPHRFRFWVSAADAISVSLVGSELHHLTKVLRLPVGTEIEVFDGRGWVASGMVEGVYTQTASIRILQVEPTRILKPIHSICLGALKPNSCDDILPPLVELGIDAFHLFLSEGNARHRGSESAQARWQRILLTAVKQCKRPTIPSLAVWSSCKALLQANLFSGETQRWLLDPESSTRLGNGLSGHAPSVLAVGSEKGLSSAEVSLFQQAGFIPVSLGDSILRATTAAIAGVAILSHFSSFQEKGERM